MRDCLRKFWTGCPLPLLAIVFHGLLLTACGGAKDTETSPVSRVSTSGATTDESEAMAQGAVLNARDLRAADLAADAADQGADSAKAAGVVPKSAYQSGEVVRKALASQVPVYRFYNSHAASHFYTVNASERDAILSNPALSHMLFEGPAFSASSAPADGFTPVYRFLNAQTGVHFYTISLSERDAIIANPALQHYFYEGVAYYAGMVGGEGLMPLYRFFVPSKGFHFYTANAAERNGIRNAMGHLYSYEGVASYVVASAVLGEQLPHSGISSSQCYQYGNPNPVSCDSAGALALNPQQDGHRAGINPISYSLLPGFGVTSCVKDNVTGLIWEGKTATGVRAGSNTYTYFRDGRKGDASAYVNTVNASRLCGFSDWRIPTVFELLTLLDFGKGGPYDTTPMLDSAWFPNLPQDATGIASDGNAAAGHVAYVEFVQAVAPVLDLNVNPIHGFHLRLVRGTPPSGARFTFTTYPYGSDAGNNVAQDAWTGLQWRRCLVGQTWNGATCTGNVADLTLYNALSLARQASGWRMPNVRELNSLLEVGRLPANKLDPVAFPGSLGPDGWSYTGEMWSSTPGPRVVSFIGNQFTSAAPDYQGFTVRLVRAAP